MKHKILLIEDEIRLSRILTLVLKDHGYQVTTAIDGGQGIDIWNQWNPELVITDLNMHPVDGMAVLKFGQLNFPDVPLIILTAFGSIEIAVGAMKTGAFDFLSKPVDHGQLLEIVEQALVSDVNNISSFEAMIGSSRKMAQIKKDILLYASTDSSVLIVGESGTGKEIAARAIHEASNKSKGPFVKVNCAAIPRDLIESELFGHIKGAFTGAAQSRKGAFLQAKDGILFLDEIGDLPFDLQAKLLHAVEEKTITPIGAEKPIPVAIKIISATNRDIATMISESKFREDLYYRLNTVCLSMPALREKPDDINELVMFFIKKFCREFNRPVLKVDSKVMYIFEHYPWPGNVRELSNVIERAVITCGKGIVTRAYIPETIINPTIYPTLHSSLPEGMKTHDLDLSAHEQNLLKTALEKCSWNQSRAAKELCITRSALRYRLQKYGIQKE